MPPVEVEIPGDLSEAEKLEIVNEVAAEAERRNEAQRRSKNPLSDPHGDPDAS